MLASLLVLRSASLAGVGRRAARLGSAFVGGVLLLSGLAARPADAAGWKLESSNSVTLLTDGGDYAVWDGPRAGQAVVLNTATGQRRVVTLPAGCELDGGYSDDVDRERTAAGGRALQSCKSPSGGDRVVSLYDLSTGATTPLPGSGTDFNYSALGSQWAKGTVTGGCTSPAGCERFQYVNVVTGQQVNTSQDVVDLDQTTLPPACGRLISYSNVKSHSLLAVAAGSYYSSKRAGNRYAVRQVGCTSIATLTTERLPARSFQAAGGLVSWTTAYQATDYSFRTRAAARVPAVVAVRSTSGGKVKRLRAPVHTLHTPGDQEQLRGSFGVLAHTKHQLFFLTALRLDTQGIDFVDRAAVYSRPLSG